MIDDAREHEQQIGQPVDVADEHRVDRRLERDHPALGAAADRARDVQRGAGGVPPARMKRRERRQLGLEPIDQLLEPRRRRRR